MTAKREGSGSETPRRNAEVKRLCAMSEHLERYVSQLERELTADRAQEWRPIESAPRDSLILLWGRYWSDEQGFFPDPMVGMWSVNNNRWECTWMCRFGVRPTHWMPLPQPPKESASDDSISTVKPPKKVLATIPVEVRQPAMAAPRCPLCGVNTNRSCDRSDCYLAGKTTDEDIRRATAAPTDRKVCESCGKELDPTKNHICGCTFTNTEAEIVARTVEQIASAIIRDVAELPDRSSPDDWPEAMLVTGDELREIVRRALNESAKEKNRG